MKNNEFQNYFQWVVLIGIPKISKNVNNTHILSIWNLKKNEWNWKWIITKILVWKILIKSYLSLFHPHSNILVSIIFIFIKIHKQNEGISFNTINGYICMDRYYTVIYSNIKRERKRERDSVPILQIFPHQ